MLRKFSYILVLYGLGACGADRASIRPLNDGATDGRDSRDDKASGNDTGSDRGPEAGADLGGAADAAADGGALMPKDGAADTLADAARDVAPDSAVDAPSDGADGRTDVPSGDSTDSAAPSDATTRADTAGANDASAALDAGGVTFRAWPGAAAVAVVDQADYFGQDLSGLVYQPGATPADDNLWAVQNGTSKLFLLGWDGSLFQPRDVTGWQTGKVLQYPKASGSPDAEGLTMADWQDAAIYVSAERDNEAKTVSRMSVLRYDLSADGTPLVATHEWNLTADLPASDPNKGLEGLAWIPDSYLTARGFVDESTGRAYSPRNDDDHGSGLFFAGLESNGVIYAYSLDHRQGTFKRIATINSGLAEVIDLTFDRDVGTLWSYCDDGCGNRATLLDIDGDPGSPTRGHFVVRAAFDRPSGLPNAGNEGIALAPESECAQGKKAFIWSDDSNTDGHALRRGTVPCGRLY